MNITQQTTSPQGVVSHPVTNTAEHPMEMLGLLIEELLCAGRGTAAPANVPTR